MNTIQPSFTERGFNFTLVERKGQIALYHRCKPGGSGHWELVRLRVAAPTVIYGREYPEREVYPRSEAWGTDGFTFVSLELAKARFAEMAIAPFTSSQGSLEGGGEG